MHCDKVYFSWVVCEVLIFHTTFTIRFLPSKDPVKHWKVELHSLKLEHRTS